MIIYLVVSDHLPGFVLCNYIGIGRTKEKCFKYVHDTRVERIEAFGAALKIISGLGSYYETELC